MRLAYYGMGMAKKNRYIPSVGVREADPCPPKLSLQVQIWSCKRLAAIRVRNFKRGSWLLCFDWPRMLHSCENILDDFPCRSLSSNETFLRKVIAV